MVSVVADLKKMNRRWHWRRLWW